MQKIDFKAEFENDEAVIGRWEIIDMVYKKEDFIPPSDSHSKNRNVKVGLSKVGISFDEIYFLPEGISY